MKNRWWAIAAKIAVVLIITGVALLWHAYRVRITVPVINVPVMKMPSPNAFDYFVKAGNQLDLSKDFGSVFNKEAFSSKGGDKIIEHNQLALQTLRQGLAYDYMHPLKYRFDDTYPENTQFRNLARLLTYEGKAKAGRGDWSGAMNSYLDGIVMGEETPNGGGLLGKLVGISIQRICRGNAWETLGHLTEAQARAAIARVESISRHHLSTDGTLEEERIRGLLSLQDNFSGKCKAPEVKYFPQLPNHIKRKVLVGYAAYMDECIHAVRQPYAAKPPTPSAKRWRCTDPLVYAKEGPVYVILALYCAFPCDTLWFDDTRCETQNRLLATALALRAYRVENSQYPNKLAGLVPAYLKSLPDDPFALKGTFGYRREGDKYVLWSVGPDSKDDGGKPICDLKAPARERYRTDSKSRGDIVASVNDR